jgi:hypothetical protein
MDKNSYSFSILLVHIHLYNLNLILPSTIDSLKRKTEGLPEFESGSTTMMTSPKRVFLFLILISILSKCFLLLLIVFSKEIRKGTIYK